MLHKHMHIGEVKAPRKPRSPAAAGPAPTVTPSIDYGPLPGHIGYALRRAQLAVFADFIATLEHVDLRPAEFSVLTLIGANPGIFQRVVCDALAIKPANFVPLYAELERRRLTKRVAIDGRSKGLYLTVKGRELAARAQSLCDEHQRRITARLGEAACQELIDHLFALAEIAPASGGHR